MKISKTLLYVGNISFILWFILFLTGLYLYNRVEVSVISYALLSTLAIVEASFAVIWMMIAICTLVIKFGSYGDKS